MDLNDILNRDDVPKDIKEALHNLVIKDKEIFSDQSFSTNSILNAFLEISPVAFAFIERKTITWTNELAHNLLGYENGYLIGKSTSILFSSNISTDQSYQALFKGLENQNQKFSQIETKWMHKNGHEIDILIRIRPINPSNVGDGVLAIAMDITQQKNRESRYRLLFDESPVSLWEEDFSAVYHLFMKLKQEGIDNFRDYIREHPEIVKKCANLITVLDVNQATLDFYNIESKDFFLNKSLNEIFPKLNYKLLKEELIALAEGKNEYKTEGTTRDFQNKLFNYNLRLNVPVGYEHNLSRVLISVIDITSYKQAEQYLKSQKDEINLYLDILTHDLRNYHTAARGYLDLALNDALSKDFTDSVEFLTHSRSSMALASALTDDISIMMRKKIIVDYSLFPVSVYSTTVSAQISIREIFPSKDINLDIMVDKKAVILADSLFEQLLLNLLTNAVKNDKSKTIKIVIQAELTKDNKYLLTITDFGKGIPPENREGIFTRFHEFRNTGRGSGLGLYIVNTLVDRYQGQIWIESQNSENYALGTKFCLLFQSHFKN